MDGVGRGEREREKKERVKRKGGKSGRIKREIVSAREGWRWRTEEE